MMRNQVVFLYLKMVCKPTIRSRISTPRRTLSLKTKTKRLRNSPEKTIFITLYIMPNDVPWEDAAVRWVFSITCKRLSWVSGTDRKEQRIFIRLMQHVKRHFRRNIVLVRNSNRKDFSDFIERLLTRYLPTRCSAQQPKAVALSTCHMFFLIRCFILSVYQ